MDSKDINPIDTYVKNFPKEVQKSLNEIRSAIKRTVPDMIEVISYGMPTCKLEKKNLVHFAAWKTHIGFYALPSTHTKFKKELSKYKGAKGSVQFPLDKPLPLSLILKMVKFRVKEIKEAHKAMKQNETRDRKGKTRKK